MFAGKNNTEEQKEMKYHISIVLGAVLICTVCLAGEKESAGRSEPAVAEEAGTIPGAPAALRLKIVQNGFQLSWTLSPHDPGKVTGYEIVRSDRFSGPFDSVTTVGKGISQYIDTTALPEIIYFYKVRSVAGKGYSPFSNTVTGER
jgi:hypothetical protein